MSFYLKLFAVIFVVVRWTAAENVPVLIWSNNGNFASVGHTILAGQTVAYREVIDYYLKPFLADKTPFNFVVFIQDEMSLSDITVNAGLFQMSESIGNSSFQPLKAIMSTHAVATFPRVSLPLTGNLLSAMKEIFPTSSRVHSLQPPFLISQLDLSTVTSNVIEVRLLKTDGSKSSTMGVYDSLESVTKQLSDLHQPFVAVYTAIKSRQGDSEVGAVRRGRQLLQAKGSDSALMGYVPDMFMMYASEITVQQWSDKTASTILTIVANSPQTWTTDGTKCVAKAKTCEVTMVYKGKGGPFTLQMTSELTKDGYWWTRNMSFSMPKEKGIVVSTARQFDKTTPGYSYHCSKGLKLWSKNDYILKFQDLQFQAFKIKKNRFGYYNDCVAFLSIGSWMGLAAAFTFVAICIFGIYMVQDIKAVDRFDDPKKLVDMRTD